MQATLIWADKKSAFENPLHPRSILKFWNLKLGI
jgi:hypothetical protein